jgi:hypothetical protein
MRPIPNLVNHETNSSSRILEIPEENLIDEEGRASNASSMD